MKKMKLMAIGAVAALAATSMSLRTAVAAEAEQKEHSEKMTMPDTAEGILQEIHKHHGELAEVVKSKSWPTYIITPSRFAIWRTGSQPK